MLAPGPSAPCVCVCVCVWHYYQLTHSVFNSICPTGSRKRTAQKRKSAKRTATVHLAHPRTVHAAPKALLKVRDATRVVFVLQTDQMNVSFIAEKSPTPSPPSTSSTMPPPARDGTEEESSSSGSGGAGASALFPSSLPSSTGATRDETPMSEFYQSLLESSYTDDGSEYIPFERYKRQTTHRPHSQCPRANVQSTFFQASDSCRNGK